MEEVSTVSPLILEVDESCDEKVSKVLLIHDCKNEATNAMIGYLSSQGYHVITVLVEDNMFQNVRSFAMEFEKVVKERKKDFVYGVVAYSRRESDDMCMYCSSLFPKNALLLKQAFACMYVQWGREKCALIAPERCCDYSTAHLPKLQTEGMLISFNYTPELATKEGVEAFPKNVWDELGTKLDTLRIIASYKEDTRHVRTIVDPVPEIVEEPLSTEDVLTLIGKYLDTLGPIPDKEDNDDTYAKRLAGLLGTSGMEWDEHKTRAGEQSVFLLLKRCMMTIKTDPWLTVADSLDIAVECPELSQLCRDKHAENKEGIENESEKKKGVFLSHYPALQDIIQNHKKVSTMRSGPWKDDVKEKPDAEGGTHLDKIKVQFLPPHMRHAVENPNNIDQEEIKRIQKLDAEYEKRKLEREIKEHQLLGGFSAREKILTGAGNSGERNCMIPKMANTNIDIK